MTNESSGNNTRKFTDTNIEDALGAEVSLFLHCHLSDYDKAGDGKTRDNGEAKSI
jgi:hypothetical protein